MNSKDEYIYDDSKDIECFMYFDSKKIEQYSDIDNNHITEYQDKLHEIVYNKPTIRIKYTYNYKSDFNPFKQSYDTGYLELNADNTKNFTRREFMFKINNELFQFYFEKDGVLEGLTFIETEKDRVSLYELAVGS